MPRKKTQGMLQEEIILTYIKELGYEPTRLPRNEPGRKGIKAEVRAEIEIGQEPFKTLKIFNNVWQRLREEKLIGEGD